MTPVLPVVSGRETIGHSSGQAAPVSQRGSHAKLRSAEGRTVIVPLHSELAPGTLRSILRQAGLSVDEFTRLIRR
jgi:predicted RNA binding protein YcfA (HicA-like mRNA interferase family)